MVFLMKQMNIETVNNSLICIYYVNTGAKVGGVSGRISKVDPRGGVAILGENGVGKTTLLRTIPIFFGATPSKIMEAVGSNDSLIAFQLPSDSSALVFEYARGSDKPEDRRLVVVRRERSNPDVPFYRLYKCGFDENLFLKDGRFLADEEADKYARANGIKVTPKLNSSEYRSVILKTPIFSKERERIRSYSFEWSFGEKPLEHLDVLLVAMLKKGLSIKDMIKVVVSMVQQELGRGIEAKGVLPLNAGKANIVKWLADYESASDAIKQSGNVDKLRENLSNERVKRQELAALYADVNKLEEHRKAQKSKALKEQQDFWENDRKLSVIEVNTENELTAQLIKANENSVTARQNYEAELLQEKYFIDQKVQEWADRIDQLPVQHQAIQQLSRQIFAAQSKSTEVAARYAQLKQQAQTSAMALQAELEKQKEPHRVRKEEADAQIAELEANDLQALEELVQGRRELCEQERDPLVVDKGVWEQRKRNPDVSKEKLDVLEQARTNAELIGQQHAACAQELFDLRRAKDLAQMAYDKHEAEIRQAASVLDREEWAVKHARAMLTPDDKSMLAVLRSGTDESWKKNLAKVLNPQLLSREDLDARFLEDLAGTCYGWELNLGVLDVPDWADDDKLREAVVLAEQRYDAAKTQLQTLKDGLQSKFDALEKAGVAVSEKEAALAVLSGKKNHQKQLVELAQLQVEEERRNGVKKAQEQIESIDAKLKALSAQRTQIEVDYKREKEAIGTLYAQQREQAKKAMADAIKSLDASIQKSKTDAEQTLKSFDDQLAQQLSANGVDVKALQSMQSEMDKLQKEVEGAEAKKPLVALWRNWLREVGPAKVQQLKKESEDAAAALQEKRSALSVFNEKTLQSKRERNEKSTQLSKRIDGIVKDLEALDQLKSVFDGLQPGRASVIEADFSVQTLQGRVYNQKKEWSDLQQKIQREYDRLRVIFTARESQVKEFFDAKLAALDGADALRKAEELCIAYRQMDRQVVSSINLMLRTLMEYFSAFTKSINDFEKEVKNFNRKFQEGLSKSDYFKRVKNVKVDIVTDFETLDIYKKLLKMDRYVRENAALLNMSIYAEANGLPPIEMVHALKDLASVLKSDGGLEINLGSHIILRGSAVQNEKETSFRNTAELMAFSSTGLTQLLFVILVTALFNTIRQNKPVHVPLLVDEVATLDAPNFLAMMAMFRDNHIDGMTAAPELGAVQLSCFARRYLLVDGGRIREYRKQENEPGAEVL